jgi:hypothetical protein
MRMFYFSFFFFFFFLTFHLSKSKLDIPSTTFASLSSDPLKLNSLRFENNHNARKGKIRMKNKEAKGRTHKSLHTSQTRDLVDVDATDDTISIYTSFLCTKP